MAGLLHLVQRGGDWAGPQPARPLFAVPNVTAHPSVASAPINVLLCGFNVPITWLKRLIGIRRRRRRLSARRDYLAGRTAPIAVACRRPPPRLSLIYCDE